jgi:hypothetical protein
MESIFQAAWAITHWEASVRLHPAYTNVRRKEILELNY